MNTSTVKTILCFLLIIPIMANARSNDIQTWIEQIGRQYAPDSRTAIYTVSSELLNDSIHILKGKCDNRQAVETLLRTLDTAGISYINAIKLLPDRRLGEKTRGIVTVCCAHLRSEPRHSAEMSLRLFSVRPCSSWKSKRVGTECKLPIITSVG